MGNFPCGVERAKRSVNVHMHWVVSNLKKDKQNVYVAPLPWKNYCGRPCPQSNFGVIPKLPAIYLNSCFVVIVLNGTFKKIKRLLLV